jgi:putative ABC transport system permease protein
VSVALYTGQECLRSAAASIVAHGLRSVLTMFGIVVGVASVVCVIALVQGMAETIGAQLRGLGGNALTVRSFTALEDQLRGKTNRLTPNDVAELRYRIDGITDVTPNVLASQRFGAEVHSGSDVASAQMFGTTSSYQDVQQLFALSGRFITESDNSSHRRVIVLGEQVRKDLRLPADPSGRFVQINDEWFKVIGTMEQRGEVFGINQDSFVLMPYETALAITSSTAQPNLWITFSVRDPDRVGNIRGRVAALLRRLHHLKPAQPDDFVIESADALAKSFREISTTITLVVAGVVSISLLVGGVGIMNIMLVSVTERTREIGIAKALGAPRIFILLQFLIEATLLALIGSLFGVVLGFALSYGIASLIPKFPAPQVPWWAVAACCAFSALTGIGFGILPASNAANLTPIEALRYE